MSQYLYDGTSFEIKTKNDTLQACFWEPSGIQPNHVIIMIHPLGSFITHSHETIDRFVKNGGIVYACDHKGHGRSSGKCLHVSVQEVIDETYQVINHAFSRNKNMPIIMYGCSTGGLIALQSLFQKFSDCLPHVSALVVDSPFISTGIQTRMSFLNSLLFLITTFFFPDLLIKFDVLPSGDDETTLYHPYLPMWVYQEILSTITAVRQAEIPQIPILMLQGDADTVCDPNENIAWGNEIKETHLQFELKIFRDGPHNLAKSELADSVFNEIFMFISQTV